ncbi:MAG: DUF362 domain-containing protein [Nitrososphaerota archaeon]|jgi:uncharacterized protein (DUF362 family)|nr:DUF362 domain-containing protein [Nitrososphaerota archaeon]
MEQSTVAVIEGKRGLEPVFRALDLIDYKTIIGRFSQVLIKVNFITTMTWDSGATTDPVVVEALIQRLKQLPIEILVVESDATMTNADKAFEATGMAEMCNKYGVKCLNLRHIEDKVKIKIPDGKAIKDVVVPRIVAQSAIISAAKMKTHMATKVTLGMKNMFGLLPDKFKFKYHAMGISKVIVDINTVLKPHLTVIDGFTAMEGRGPTEGTPIEMNLILAGSDPVATDATCSRIMGIDPHEISHIKEAAKKELGNIDDIRVLGSQIADVKQTFKRK